MKVLAPTSVKLDESLLGLTEHDVLVAYDPAVPLAPADYDADVLIAWANTAEQLADCAKNLKDVKLVQALLAGPDQVRAAGFVDRAVIASGVGLHSLTVAEHALALTLNFVRFLPTLAGHQEQRCWAGDLGGAQELHPRDRVTTLLDAEVTIWGFGSIGQETARLFSAFGARVTGVARRAGERAGFPVITEQELGEQLQKTDVLVMVLPASQETTHALNAERLAQLRSRAYVINVGRGVTVDEPALVEALNGGEIAGAAVDVASVEPYPADGILWGAKNLVITPHSAGGRPVDPESLIAQNVQALRDEQAGRSANWRNRI